MRTADADPLDRWPPDHRLPGTDVAAILATGDPADIDGVDDLMVALLSSAVGHLHDAFARFGRTWPLEKYDILVTSDDDQGLARVAFCPQVETLVNGIPFEVADGGMWANGPAPVFDLALADQRLVKTTWQR